MVERNNQCIKEDQQRFHKNKKKASNYMCFRNQLLVVIMETFTFIRFLSMFSKPRMVQISAKCPLIHIIFCELWCNYPSQRCVQRLGDEFTRFIEACHGLRGDDHWLLIPVRLNIRYILFDLFITYNHNGSS